MTPEAFTAADMGLTFSVDYEAWGATVTAELEPGGEAKAVTAENREQSAPK